MRDKELFHSKPLGTQTLTGAMILPATGSPTWQTALRAAEAKKAADIRILDLREITSFADFFLICTGSNQRQTQAIWDEIAKQMKETYGETPLSVEGYSNGEWVLGDFGDLVVHIFTEEKRHYYDLERLWRDAKSVTPPPPGPSLVS
jgi:ribosome-associated protein